MPDLSFEIVRESDQWADDRILKRLTGRVVAVLRDHIEAGHIDFVFTDDSMVQILNREWRGKDKPTNVLSFPDGDEEDGVIHLGDVIMGFETIAKEALELDVPFEDHLTHLLLHGSLHLVGFDHMTDEDAKVMESLEIKLLADLGIKDPYQGPPVPLD